MKPLAIRAFVIGLLAAMTMAAQEADGFLGDSLSEEAFLESLKPIEDRPPPSVLPALLKLAEKEAQAELQPEGEKASEENPAGTQTADDNGLPPQDAAAVGGQEDDDHSTVDGEVVIKRNAAGAVTEITYLDGLNPRTISYMNDEEQSVTKDNERKPSSTMGPSSHSLFDILARPVTQPPSRQEDRQNAGFHHQERSRQQNTGRNGFKYNNIHNHGGMPRHYWMGTPNAPPHSFDAE